MQAKNLYNWEPKKYHSNSCVQKNAATKLLQCIKLRGHERVLDVGCGDGKITAQIAESLKSGTAKGIDISKEMISFATKEFPKYKYQNLSFELGNAQSFIDHEKFDLIFSSFALQWLPDPSDFFKCAYKNLNSSGYLAATIPLGISTELEKAINQTISLPKWKLYFENFSPEWHFLRSEKYSKLLFEHGFQINLFQVVDQTVIFQSRLNFEEYVMTWFSYLQPLPTDLKLHFFKDVIDKYFAISEVLCKNEVLFTFSRLDLLAKKISL